MGGIVPTGAGDFSAWMGTGSAEKQAVDRCLVSRPASHGTLVEELIRDDVKVADVSVSQAHAALQIHWRKQ